MAERACGEVFGEQVLELWGSVVTGTGSGWGMSGCSFTGAGRYASVCLPCCHVTNEDGT